MNYRTFTFVFALFILFNMSAVMAQNDGEVTRIYNVGDVATLRNYLDKKAGNSTNGAILASNDGKTYNSDDPGTFPVTWKGEESNLRVSTIMWIPFNAPLSDDAIVLSNLTALENVTIAFTTPNMLDLSGCSALEKLNCSVNSLEVLKIDGCVALNDLNCSENYITKLNLSTNRALKVLDCSINELTGLNVSVNTELVKLKCLRNQINALDVSSNIKLLELDCDSNPIGVLDITKLTVLQSLLCGRCGLSEIDLSKNIELTYLNCTGNSFTELDLSHCLKLKQLLCAGNKLTTLDLSKNSVITHVACFANLLTAMDMTKNAELYELNCFENPLADVNVKGCKKLNNLGCSSSQISKLDVSTNTSLQFLFCRSTKITGLDLSNNVKLNVLDCSDNSMVGNLDLSKNIELMRLVCDSIDATEINFGSNPQLYEVHLQGNKFAISTMPYSVDWRIWNYSPQQDLEIVLQNENQIDLSKEALVRGKKTEFIWKSGEATLVEGTDYEELTPGVFVFLKEFKQVYCEMWHELFPNLTLKTTPVDVQPSSMPNEHINIGINLYPNPCIDGLLNILCEDSISNICVYDMTGKQIAAISGIHAMSYLLDLSSYQKGMYLVSIQTINKTLNQKVTLR